MTDMTDSLSFAMKNCGMSTAELAKRAGIAPTTLYSIIRRGNKPSAATAAKLAAALGLPTPVFSYDAMLVREIELIRLFRDADERSRQDAIMILKAHSATNIAKKFIKAGGDAMGIDAYTHDDGSTQVGSET